MTPLFEPVRLVTAGQPKERNQYVGCVNADEFRGHAPGTLMFCGAFPEKLADGTIQTTLYARPMTKPARIELSDGTVFLPYDVAEFAGLFRDGREVDASHKAHIAASMASPRRRTWASLKKLFPLRQAAEFFIKHRVEVIVDSAAVYGLASIGAGLWGWSPNFSLVATGTIILAAITAGTLRSVPGNKRERQCL